MSDETGTRYDSWRGLEAGSFALARCRDLLRSLLAGWPRRARSMLVFNAGTGSGAFLETLWEAGFDVTGQDNDQGYLERARKRLGSRSDFVLSAPNHLPFDDYFFDYAVAVAALEFWEDPEAVLREIGRVACGGLIVIFPCAWSLFALECRAYGRTPLCVAANPLLLSPRNMDRLLKRVFGKNKTVWRGTLLGPSRTWGEGSWLKPLNGLRLPLPLGAFAGVRVNFGSLYAGTPILLRSSSSVATVE